MHSYFPSRPVRPAFVATAAALLIALGGCAQVRDWTGQGGAAPTARTELDPRSGSQVSGSVTFAPQGEGRLRVTADLRGLKPNAEHGFHVHERGDCSAADATSAGGHFNPGAQPHGAPDAPARHAGDMPNLRADGEGRARASFTVSGLSAGTGAPNDIIGRAVVVHRDPDDFRSQPAGNSGPRVACGVIRAGAGAR